jgi:hypothetical protein
MTFSPAASSPGQSSGGQAIAQTFNSTVIDAGRGRMRLGARAIVRRRVTRMVEAMARA